MRSSTDDFAARLAAAAQDIETLLGRLLADEALPGEIARPPRLMEAMRHAVLGGGKRLRPFLAVETARMLGNTGGRRRPGGAAIELVHCYSLVHDDLPAMDDDDLRRGKPTVHRAFDEATAILVGDGLQTLAFEVLADPQTDADPAGAPTSCSALPRRRALAAWSAGRCSTSRPRDATATRGRTRPRSAACRP
jgi:farnesyl diphosphate synthase